MILFLKAARGIWRGKRSYIACVVLMSVGIMLYTSYNIMAVNLSYATEKMYDGQRFANAFAKVRGIPVNAVSALGSMPGIARAEGCLTADARVMLPGKDEKIITLRVHSFDPGEPEPLNEFLIVNGGVPGENEILVGNAFFEANALSAGDTLSLVMRGKQLNFTVSGSALSPEYVYVISDTGQMIPDNEAFGFAYVSYSRLSSILGEQGLANSLSFALEDDVKFSALQPALEDALAPYGLIGVYDRKGQLSAAMVEQELAGISSMATSMPMVFIVMAVIILYIMLKRVIEQERGSIGVLKAFGFSNREILNHYLCYGLITGGLGGLLGCGLGWALSGWMTQLYLMYFNLPALKNELNPAYMLYGMLISLVSGALGAFMGTRGSLALSPSEAMRPPSPPVVTRDILGRLRFLRAILASNGFMAIRNISRSGFRSLFVVLGISFSFALIGLMSSYPDMMDKIMLDLFTKVQVYDVKISLKEPVAALAAEEAVYGVGNVTAAEAMLELPAELRLANLKEGVSITAMERGSALQRIYDNDRGVYLEPPQDGLIIGKALAKKLAAKRGDVLMAKTPYTGDEEIAFPVMDVIGESMGLGAYMELGSLCDALGVPKSANAVIMDTPDPSFIKDALRNADNVTAVSDQTETVQIYTDMLKTYDSMFIMMQLAGMGVAFAIIVNTSSVSLSERKREYATLRVLGMHPGEVAKILGFEYWLLTFVGILPGIPLVRILKIGMSQMIDESFFSIPLDTPLSCYITAGLLCIATVALCNQLARRQIKKFDMVEVLKERE